uniref:Putative secreted protein n=1 Tax=Anopheles darlingi TaxID=43151 RepID=A0A2M4DF70_ANODA
MCRLVEGLLFFSVPGLRFVLCGCQPCQSIHLREFSRFQRLKRQARSHGGGRGPSTGDGGCQRQMTKVRKRGGILFSVRILSARRDGEEREQHKVPLKSIVLDGSFAIGFRVGR